MRLLSDEQIWEAWGLKGGLPRALYIAASEKNKKVMLLSYLRHLCKKQLANVSGQE